MFFFLRETQQNHTVFFFKKRRPKTISNKKHERILFSAKMYQHGKKRQRQDSNAVWKKPRSVEEAMPLALRHLFYAAHSLQPITYMTALEVQALYSIVLQNINATTIQASGYTERKINKHELECAPQCKLDQNSINDKPQQTQKPSFNTSFEPEIDYAQILCLLGESCSKNS